MYLFFCVNLSLLRLAFSSPLLSLLCLSLRLSLSVSHSVSRFGSLSLSLAPVERGGGGGGGGEQRSDCAKEGLQKGRVPQICTGGRALVTQLPLESVGRTRARSGGAESVGTRSDAAHRYRRRASLHALALPTRG
jgi:hypothetical protein